MSNLIENAYFLNKAGETVPVGNHFTSVGDVLENPTDPGILAIDSWANNIELVKDSKYITIAVERDEAIETGTLAFSIYAKGEKGFEIKVTVSTDGPGGSVIKTEAFLITPNLTWERFTDYLFDVAVLDNDIDIKIENTSASGIAYIAMPQFEEASASTDFAIGE